MRKKKFVAVTIVLVIIVSLFISNQVAKAEYDNFNLFTELSVDNPAEVLQLMQSFEGAYDESNVTGITVGDLMSYFVYESKYAPFYQGKKERFPHDMMTSFSDSKYQSSFSGSAQCMAFSNWISAVVYGGNGPRLYPQSNGVEDLKNFFVKYAQPGEHIRWDAQHSAIFLAASERGIYYLHRIINGEIKLSYYSYADMSSLLINKNLNIYLYNSVAKENAKIGPLDTDDISMYIVEGMLHVNISSPVTLLGVYAGISPEMINKIQPTSIWDGVLHGYSFDLKEHFGLKIVPNSTVYCKVIYENYNREWESELYEVKYHISEKKTEPEKQINENDTPQLPTVFPEFSELIQKPDETPKVNDDEQINNNTVVDELVVNEEVIIEIPEETTKVEEPQKLYRWRTVTTSSERKISDVPVTDAGWRLVDTQSETNYSQWSDWTETEIQPSNVVEVETKQEQQEVVVSTKKEFNYSYYTYQHNGQKYYTYSEEYAIAMGGGEKVERGWGTELFLYTLYDGAVYGTDYVDNGIWFNEQSRLVPITAIETKTFYRSREKNIREHYIYEVTKKETSAWSDWSPTIPVGGPGIEIEEKIVTDRSYI